MKKNSKLSNVGQVEEPTEKLRKTLVFSKKNADIYDVLENMKKNKVNISEYICTLIRNDLHKKEEKEKQHTTDNQLEKIQNQLDIIKNLIETRSFTAAIDESLGEEPTIEIVAAKDIVVDDIDDMLGL